MNTLHMDGNKHIFTWNIKNRTDKELQRAERSSRQFIWRHLLNICVSRKVESIKKLLKTNLGNIRGSIYANFHICSSNNADLATPPILHKTTISCYFWSIAIKTSRPVSAWSSASTFVDVHFQAKILINLASNLWISPGVAQPYG